MKTIIYDMSDPEQAERGYKEAAEILRAGGNVAFPTETVYGLGGWTGSEEAVRGIFTAKGRPSDNPLIVHVCPGMDLSPIAVRIPETARELMHRFWPGPLTLILWKAPEVPDAVSAGLPSVAVRMPSHPVAMRMLEVCGLPVAAPSANLSGRPSPTTAQHVWEDMQGRIPLILDGGPCEIGLESTIVDMTVEPPMVLRPGGLPLETLREVVPDLRMDPGLGVAANVTPKAPGMKYRHYAPKAPMTMARGTPSEQEEKIRRALAQARGKKRGVLTVSEHVKDYDAEAVLAIGSLDDPDEMAAHLFDALRRFDELECDVIFAETIPQKGIGTAYMNRLRKACGGSTI
jgi:L-threonylcarbamoyladenylate synthase